MGSDLRGGFREPARSAARRCWPAIAPALAVLCCGVCAGVGWVGVAEPGSCLTVGDRAPDIAGRAVMPSGSAGRVTVMAFFCGCQTCRGAIAELRRATARGDRMSVTGIFSGTPAEAQEFRSATHAPFPLIADPVGKIHGRWRVEACPAFFAVGRGGILTEVVAPQDPKEVRTAVVRLYRAAKATIQPHMTR